MATRRRMERRLFLVLGRFAFGAVAVDHRIGFVSQPLAGRDAGAQLLLILFDFARLTFAPGGAAFLVRQVDCPSRFQRTAGGYGSGKKEPPRNEAILQGYSIEPTFVPACQTSQTGQSSSRVARPIASLSSAARMSFFLTTAPPGFDTLLTR